MRICGHGTSITALLLVSLAVVSVSSCIEGGFKTTVGKDTPGEADTQTVKDVVGDVPGVETKDVAEVEVVAKVEVATDAPCTPDCTDKQCGDDDGCGGACVEHTQCDDCNPCTADSCDADGKQCKNEAAEGACDDGDLCTVDDACNGGVCLGIPSQATEGTCKDDGVCSGLIEPLCVDLGEEVLWLCDYAAVEGYEPYELSCDNQDNDCDGKTDEQVCPVCKPGTLDCDGTMIIECNGDGTGWDEEGDCKMVAPNDTCMGAGVCVPSGEFEVNDVTTGYQFDSRSTILADGRILVTWASEGIDDQGYGIAGRFFDNGGHALGNQFKLNTFEAQDQRRASAVALPDGGFVLIWETADGVDGEPENVQWQRYDLQP